MDWRRQPATAIPAVQWDELMETKWNTNTHPIKIER